MFLPRPIYRRKPGRGAAGFTAFVKSLSPAGWYRNGQGITVTGVESPASFAGAVIPTTSTISALNQTVIGVASFNCTMSKTASSI